MFSLEGIEISIMGFHSYSYQVRFIDTDQIPNIFALKAIDYMLSLDVDKDTKNIFVNIAIKELVRSLNKNGTLGKTRIQLMTNKKIDKLITKNIGYNIKPKPILGVDI